MTSEWRVSTTYAGGEKLYQVYRKRNEYEQDHSGNREIIGTFDSAEMAREYADARNRMEGVNE